ncbi:MAG: SUMF1/EgtB/PvdO family nonheme iron enzyme [Verrucomicrobiales bacterium]|nr:SUMF1/EgtB/PvdO family nonheme iron enzyme [Verrucomicrobiales bacterium]
MRPQGLGLGLGPGRSVAGTRGGHPQRVCASGEAPPAPAEAHHFPRLPWLALALCLTASLPAQAANGYLVGWGDNFWGQWGAPGFLSPSLAVAGGSYFTLSLQEDGTVRGAGENFDGQASPPPDLTNAVAVAAGLRHGIALRQDGTVVAWGTQTTVPPGLDRVMAIAAGLEHSLALRDDGTVVAWGQNTSGECDVPPGLDQVVGIAAGNNFSLAVRADGTVAAWGADTFNRLSTARTFTNVTAVAAYGARSIALTSSGPLAWGPGAVPLESFTNVQQVACGEDHFMALQGDGTVLAWAGWNQNGQLNVPPGLANVVQIGAGAAHSLALVMDPQPPVILVPPAARVLPTGKPAALVVSAVGPVPLRYQWFRDGAALPGATNRVLVLPTPAAADAGLYTVRVANLHGSVTSPTALVQVAGTAPTIKLGPSDVLANLLQPVRLEVFADGAEPLAYQWRHNDVILPGETNSILFIPELRVSHAGAYDVTVRNAFGEIRSPLVRVSYRPVVGWGYNIDQQSDSPADLTDVLAVAAGNVHSLALRPDGTLYAWGGWSGGATLVPAGLTDVVEIRAQDYGNLALRDDGVLVFFGEVPRPADVLTNVVTADLAPGLGAAVLADGTVRVWSSPAAPSLRLAGMNRAVSVACSRTQVLALRSDGSLLVWDKDTPPEAWRLADPGPVAMVVAGDHHVAVLDSGGTVRAWGANNLGQTDVPAGLNDVAQLAAGNNHTLALRNDGTLVGWGTDSSGQVSGGTTLTALTSVAAGPYHSLGIVQEHRAPTWVRQPHGGTVASGRDFLMRAAALGSLPLRYQWLKDGLELPGATNDFLLLEQVAAGSGGQYQVRAHNAFGEITSRAASVDVVVGAPQLVTEPRHQVTYLGGTATFEVEATGALPLFYQWFHNGEPLAGATHGRLTLSNLDPARTGTYSVRVHNASGEVTSIEARLQLVTVAAWGGDPTGKQAVLPASLTNVVALAAGTYHSLALRADGTVVAWGLNDVRQTNVPPDLSGVVAIAAGRYYSLALKQDGAVAGWGSVSGAPWHPPANWTNLVTIDGGRDWAVALRRDGRVVGWSPSPTVLARLVTADLTNIVALDATEALAAYWRANNTLVVKMVPDLIARPAAPFGLGGAVSFVGRGDTNYVLKGNGRVLYWREAPRTGGPKPLPVSWNPVVAIASGEHHVIGLQADGTVVGAAGQAGLAAGTVPSNLPRTVQIAAGAYHSLALLAPEGPPRLWRQPAALEVFAGEWARLEVGAYGAEPLTYQWQFNGEDLPGATALTLVLGQTGPEQAGTYRVRVTNAAGMITSPEVPVTVRPRPEVHLEQARVGPEPGHRQLTAHVPPGTRWFVEHADALDSAALWRTLVSLPDDTTPVQWLESTPLLPGFRRLALVPSSPAAHAPLPIPDMVWIEPGTFLLGSPANEAGRSPVEGPQTRVTLTSGFFMGRYEVTQAFYAEVMADNPSQFRNNPRLPVHNLTYDEAIEFCRLLTQNERDLGHLPDDYEYRLPTEAEWEYAARADTTTPYYFDADHSFNTLSDHAWYNTNAGARPHPVGEKQPNPWGLHDVLGNVEELCLDYAWPYPGGELMDPVGAAPAAQRYLRGGHHSLPPSALRVANLSSAPVGSSFRSATTGFRLVLAATR